MIIPVIERAERSDFDEGWLLELWFPYTEPYSEDGEWWIDVPVADYVGGIWWDPATGELDTGDVWRR